MTKIKFKSCCFIFSMPELQFTDVYFENISQILTQSIDKITSNMSEEDVSPWPDVELNGYGIEQGLEYTLLSRFDLGFRFFTKMITNGIYDPS